MIIDVLDVTPCSFVDKYGRNGRNCCYHCLPKRQTQRVTPKRPSL